MENRHTENPGSLLALRKKVFSHSSLNRMNFSLGSAVVTDSSIQKSLNNIDCLKKQQIIIFGCSFAFKCLSMGKKDWSFSTLSKNIYYNF